MNTLPPLVADVSAPFKRAPLGETLRTHGLGADKRLGQHFLLDLNITAKIARIAAITPGAQVLEVGPGPGGLTRALLDAGAHVLAIEKDARFLPILHELAQTASDRLVIMHADALHIDERAHLTGNDAHVVSNLPYNVGTALLIKWLTGPFQPASLTLMFQREVAQRIVAEPGADAYGRLAVLAQSLAHCEIATTLPARVFTPPPKVESAVVRLTPRRDRPVRERVAALERVTAAAFGQRRKMLRSSLKILGGDALCRAAEIDPVTRAETIDLAGFMRLADAVLAAAEAG